MRRLVFILCLLVSSLLGNATNCGEQYFIGSRVSIGICKNYSRGLDAVSLYYKGVVKALDDYIALRVERGELKDKKFDIYMSDPILTRPHYALSQSKKAYYIMTGNALGLDELICLVDEFAKPNFAPIDLNVWDVYGEEAQEGIERMDRWYKKLLKKELPKTDIDNILEKEYILWQQNEMKVIFNNDKVKCFLGDQEIKHSLMGYPLVIGDRYFLQNANTFEVYEDSRLIKTFRYNTEENYDCHYMQAEVYDKWINIELYYNIKYSYSYDKNRFYLLESEND